MKKGLWGTGMINFRDLPLLYAPIYPSWLCGSCLCAERLLSCFQLYVVLCTRPPLLSPLFSASPELQSLQGSVLMLSSTSTTSLTSFCFLPGVTGCWATLTEKCIRHQYQKCASGSSWDKSERTASKKLSS